MASNGVPVVEDASHSFNTTIADAVPIQRGTHQPRTISLEGIFDLSSLTDDDFRKIIFLLKPYLTDDDRSYVTSQNISPNKKMQYLLVQVRKWTNEEKIIDYGLAVCELLYLIKQYRLLKLQPYPTRMCLHKAKVEFADSKSTNIVPKFWRLMFKLCESLDENEVAFLSRQLCEDSGIHTAEDLMIRLLRNQIISESKMDSLESAFDALSRTDLTKLIQGARSYPMERILDKPCGLALVFNHKFFKKQSLPGSKECTLTERTGTDIDAESLCELWKGFGLEVRLITDVTSTEMHSILDGVSQNDFLMDVFVCCILSHGDEGYIYASDRVCVPLETIYHKFGTSKKLEKKPKLFFIQACQGQMWQGGLGGRIINPLIQHDGPLVTENHPLYSDMLIGVSTIKGFVSFRSEVQGSFYISHLVRTLDEHWDTQDINEVLTEVNRKVSEETVEGEFKQMSTVRHQLRFKLYFKK